MRNAGCGATVVSHAGCALYSVSKNDLLQLLANWPDVGERIFQIDTAAEMRATVEDASSLRGESRIRHRRVLACNAF